MNRDIYNRFALIETLLCWGDGLTAQELGKACGLTRQNAQGVIAEYRRLHPKNLRYDRQKKRQIATETFSPLYISPEPGRFLDYQRSMAMIAYYKENEDWIDLPFQDADRLLRPNLQSVIVHAILAALRREETVKIYYYAKTGTSMRDISPNHLIFASNRYHIRAYCHSVERFIDFVLSRILHAEVSDKRWVSSKDDTEWNTQMKLVFKMNPELPEEATSAIVHDYKVNEEGVIEIRSNQALAYYVKRELLAVDLYYQCARWVLMKEEKI